MSIPIEIVSKIPMMEGLDQDTLTTVSRLMTSRSYLSHDIVMRKGEAAEHLAFLLDGKLQVVDITADGREIGLHFIMPGAYFGELSVIDGQPRSAAIISVKTSDVAFLPSAQARALIFNRPLIAQRMLTHFSQVLRASSHQRTLLSIPNAFQRVFAQLQLFVRVTNEGTVIEGLPKQHEIAIMVNTSRETVSRALHTLLKLNILVKKGSVLIVSNPEMLRNAAVVGLEESTAAAGKPVTSQVAAAD
ncbi:MAG: Crp/Fnr family transcriptional regulator [Herminiimonas sp.]|nr:Crp/Fnr family transcriptional regulator [Herminiimonas sp.]